MRQNTQAFEVFLRAIPANSRLHYTGFILSVQWKKKGKISKDIKKAAALFDRSDLLFVPCASCGGAFSVLGSSAAYGTFASLVSSATYGTFARFRLLFVGSADGFIHLGGEAGDLSVELAFAPAGDCSHNDEDVGVVGGEDDGSVVLDGYAGAVLVMCVEFSGLVGGLYVRGDACGDLLAISGDLGP